MVNTMSTLPTHMTEAHVSKSTTVNIHRVPVPKIASPTQLLIRVHVTGTNPKDWKMPAGTLTSIFLEGNSGDDIAGEVVQVGEKVFEFQPGDRVAALHHLGKLGGSYAEYAVAEDYATFKLPPFVSFDVAAGLPMISYMSCIGLFGLLQVAPGPWVPLKNSIRRPLCIYGAASGVGAMATKLAAAANIHPLICIAGSGRDYVETLIDRAKGDLIIDYRKGDQSLVEEMKAALQPGEKLEYAFDAISEHGSWRNICEVLDPHSGHITTTLPPKPEGMPNTVDYTCTMAGSLFGNIAEARRKERPDLAPDIGNLGLEEGGPEFAAVFGRWFSRALMDGKLVPHKHEVVPQGLQGLENVLQSMREKKTGSTTKYVLRIAETPGV